MDKTIFLLGLGFFIFFVLAVVFIVLYIKGRSDRIDPNNCPKVAGNYAVVPNVDLTTLKTLYQCGPNPDGVPGTSVCTFTGVSDLYEATNICNKYPNNICKTFYYNESSGGQMVIVASGYTITGVSKDNSQNGNVYVSQI